jgi:hypothetical protein
MRLDDDAVIPMIGIEAQVWEADHDPRYVISTSLPLDRSLTTSHTGHCSFLYAMSKNIHS